MTNVFQAIGDSIQGATCSNPGIATYLSRTIPAAGMVTGGIIAGGSGGAAAPAAIAAAMSTAAVGAALQGVLASCPDELPDDYGREYPFAGGQCSGVVYTVTIIAPQGVHPFNTPTTSFRSGYGPVLGVCFGPVNAFGNTPIGARFTDPATGEPYCGFDGGGHANTVPDRQASVYISSISRDDGLPDDCGDPAPLPVPQPAPTPITVTHNYDGDTVANDFSFRPSLNPKTTINEDNSVTALFEIDLSSDGDFSTNIEVAVTFKPDGTTSTKPVRGPKPVNPDPEPVSDEPVDIIPPDVVEVEWLEVTGVQWSGELPTGAGFIPGTEPLVTPQILANLRFIYDEGVSTVYQIRQAAGFIPVPPSRQKCVGIRWENQPRYQFEVTPIIEDLTNGR